MIPATNQMKEELEGWIASMIEKILREKFTDFVMEHEKKAKEISLIERLIRVEEELRSMREFEERRFEALLTEMNTRFEALQREMNTRFEALQKEMNTRFEAMNARFEALQKEMNTRFEAMNARFEAMEKRLNFLQWFVAGAFTLLTILISVLKIFG
ncbi:MAG: hypothetical protein NZ850_02650 [Caldimicrobium sp.]|nr:hypothetical protein [Caldimicrobium sp.]